MSKPTIAKATIHGKNGHVAGAAPDHPPTTDVEGPELPVDEHPPWAGDADFEKLQVPNFMASATKPTAVMKVVVRKPKAQEYVRIRPGAEWRGQYGLLRDQRTETLYVVVPELHGALADEFGYYLVVTAVNLQGELFLWPLPMADSSGRTNTWWESAFEGAQRAETAWIRLKPDQERGRYDVREAVYELPDPQWPEQRFGELFRLGFKDVVIASLEHPFVRRLRGAL